MVQPPKGTSWKDWFGADESLADRDDSASPAQNGIDTFDESRSGELIDGERNDLSTEVGETTTIGRAERVVTRPIRRIVLMGGGKEVDSSAREFVEAAQGGRVLALRFSGSTDAYNDYFATALDARPAPEHVGTLKLKSRRRSNDQDVLARANDAGGIWLAGGQQDDYYNKWSKALQKIIGTTQAAIGGTSAGAMVMGEYAFDGTAGSVRSEEVLPEPHILKDAVVRSSMGQAELANTLVETHFSDRQREGRLLTFLAWAKEKFGAEAPIGLGLDEGASIVVEDGRFEILTGFNDQHAYVYQLVGDVDLEDGEPLTTGRILRARLDHGQRGNWPPDFADLNVTELEIRNGEIHELKR